VTDQQEATRSGNLLIVGAGLIGTSIGLAAGAAGWTVRLTDTDPARARFAASLGAGEAVDDSNAAEGTASDVVVVAVPPQFVGATCVAALQAYPSAIVTHVCSVQSDPQAYVETADADVTRFVGSHPVAGREISGPAAADGGLFLDRPWAVCRAPGTADAAVTAIVGLARGCGATPVELSAAEHDRLFARLSHAPQLVASALAAAVADIDPAAAALAGTGLRDTTRLADSDPAMWGQIAAANAAAVAEAVRAVARPLLALADIVDSGDPAAVDEAVLALMRRGRAGRALLPGKHGRPAEALATVLCVVPDSPGALARLLTDIAEVGVNVEDLRVEHAPGQPVGSAELAVAPSDRAALLRTLRERGWTVTEGAGENL
jgi:prephenate dehydrogenase